MKKVMTIFITLVLILALAPAAFADVDLSGMTFDELVALRDQIDLAIWNSQEWQEVTVPQGLYKVGADIPAGKWTIRAPSGEANTVKIGSELDDNGTDVNFRGDLRMIVGENYTGYALGSACDFWTVDLRDGQYVCITNGPAVFTPYAGKPSLGFK